jgi:ABC-type antimicrobial peptide transport system permease subunit
MQIHKGGRATVRVSQAFETTLLDVRYALSFDLPAFGAGVLVVVAAALAAGYIPSRRAARVDPIQALRCD